MNFSERELTKTVILPKEQDKAMEFERKLRDFPDNPMGRSRARAEAWRKYPALFREYTNDELATMKELPQWTPDPFDRALVEVAQAHRLKLSERADRVRAFDLLARQHPELIPDYRRIGR